MRITLQNIEALLDLCDDINEALIADGRGQLAADLRAKMNAIDPGETPSPQLISGARLFPGDPVKIKEGKVVLDMSKLTTFNFSRKDIPEDFAKEYEPTP